MKSKTLDSMSQEELDHYEQYLQIKRDEMAAVRACLVFAEDDNRLDSFDVPLAEFPHLSGREVANTIRNWLTTNNKKGITVHTVRAEKLITLRKSEAPKDRNLEEWSPFIHKEESQDPDIYMRIDAGLREDYVEPDTGRVWHVKDYLECKTPGVAVTICGKYSGQAFRTVSDAAEFAHTRNYSVPFIQYKKMACSRSDKRRYY